MGAFSPVSHFKLLISLKSDTSAGVANLFRRLAFERSAVSCRGLFPQFPMARGASWRGGIGAANASIGLTVYLNARLSLRIEQDR